MRSLVFLALVAGAYAQLEPRGDLVCNGRDLEACTEVGDHFVCEFNFELDQLVSMRADGDLWPFPVSFPVFEKEEQDEDHPWVDMFYRDCPTGNYGATGVQIPEACIENEILRDDPRFIGVDGVPRRVTAINGAIPSPLLCVGYKDVIRVTLENHISGFGYEATTIHWHGMFQHFTPWMDGVAFVTQCPILPGQIFVYEFVADPPGTYWYHSHSGVQVADGEFGALIILPDDDVRENLYGDIYDIDEPEQVMMLDDWEHHNYQEVSIKNPGHWIDEETGLPQPPAVSLDGQFTGGHPFTSGLINGYGQFEDNGMQPYIFKVRQGKTHRFRIISSSAMYPFRVSFDNHRIKMLSQDGFDVEPVEIDAFIIWPAERYDIVLEANEDAVDDRFDFWVRADTLTAFRGGVAVEPGTEQVLAILHYLQEDEVAEEVDPQTIFPPETQSAFVEGGRCTEPFEDGDCVVANCPFPEIYYDIENIKCMQVGDFVRSQRIDEFLPDLSQDSQELPVIEDALEKANIVNLNFNILGAVEGDEVPNVEGVYFTLPHTAPLTDPNPFDISTMCPFDLEGNTDSRIRGEFPRCTQVVSLDFDESYLFLLTDRWPVSPDLASAANFPGIMPHPVHMHGHSFHVVSSSAGTLFDPEVDQILTNGCENGVANPEFTNVCYDEQTLSGNLECGAGFGECEIKDFDLIDFTPVELAPQKDTIMIPTHGYVLLAIRSNNPGWWITHCHIDIHMGQGMALILNEALPETLELVEDCLPEDFPICGDFENDIPATCETYPGGTKKGQRGLMPHHDPSRPDPNRDLTVEEAEKMLAERQATGRWTLPARFSEPIYEGRYEGPAHPHRDNPEHWAREGKKAKKHHHRH